MSSTLECLLIVGLSTAISVLGMHLVHKRVTRQTLESCHEVGGYMLAVIGGLYAILVGLIVVSSQAKVDAASQMAVTEANTLTHIFRLCHNFKQPGKEDIQSAVHEYAVAVVGQDWSKVEEGAETEETVKPYRKIWANVTSYVPEGENQTACYESLLDDLKQLSDARKYRMVGAKSGLSPVLWAVLIVGSVTIVLFTYFFFLENTFAQMMMTGCVAMFLSMNVYFIYLCQNPYRPELGAKESGFGFSFNPDWFKSKSEHTETKQ